MAARSLLDTSIFVYNVDMDAPARNRHIASDLIREALNDRTGVISYQVIQEFLNVVLKKSAVSMNISDAADYLNRILRPLLAVHSSVELFREAMRLRSRYQFSWYDSLIVAAALEAKCSVLYTEDLQHGMKIDRLRIENPFLSK